MRSISKTFYQHPIDIDVCVSDVMQSAKTYDVNEARNALRTQRSMRDSPVEEMTF